MGELTAEAFRDRIGGSFDVEEVGVELTLTTVDDTGPQSFALLFEGPADAPLGQATYTFGASDGSTLTIFIVPIGPGASGAPVYEAVFSSPPPD
jgi:hypothetical protein